MRSRKHSRDIYFVRARTLGFIKIGIAADALMRLSSLQVGSPDRLALMGVIRLPADEVVFEEAALHQRFAEHRKHGEWFHPAPDLLAYIARHAKLHDDLLMPTFLAEQRALMNAAFTGAQA